MQKCYNILVITAVCREQMPDHKGQVDSVIRQLNCLKLLHNFAGRHHKQNMMQKHESVTVHSTSIFMHFKQIYIHSFHIHALYIHPFHIHAFQACVFIYFKPLMAVPMKECTAAFDWIVD